MGVQFCRAASVAQDSLWIQTKLQITESLVYQLQFQILELGTFYTVNIANVVTDSFQHSPGFLGDRCVNVLLYLACILASLWVSMFRGHGEDIQQCMDGK